jgi:hypothetical protein
MARTCKASTAAASDLRHLKQTAPEHATGLLDLPGVLLCLIWQQLELADRKSLCCTARALRACEGGCSLPAVLVPGS